MTARAGQASWTDSIAGLGLALGGTAGPTLRRDSRSGDAGAVRMRMPLMLSTATVQSAACRRGRQKCDWSLTDERRKLSAAVMMELLPALVWSFIRASVSSRSRRSPPRCSQARALALLDSDGQDGDGTWRRHFCSGRQNSRLHGTARCHDCALLQLGLATRRVARSLQPRC